VSGGNLEQLIADKSRDLSWPLRIRLACDVAKGLKYVHGRGIMHRDLTSKVGVAHSQCIIPNTLSKLQKVNTNYNRSTLKEQTSFSLR